jgi:hypothetical protein
MALCLTPSGGKAAGMTYPTECGMMVPEWIAGRDSLPMEKARRRKDMPSKGSNVSHTQVVVLGLLLAAISMLPPVAESDAQSPTLTNYRTDLGYGFSVYAPQGDYAHDLGFDWIKVYDPPTAAQPTHVLYRVKVSASDWYDTGALYHRIRGLAISYGAFIDAYEIGNEVNICDEWHSSPMASRYVDLLCTAHSAIREVDPSATIVSAGLAPVGRISGTWNRHTGHNGFVQDEREYLREFLYNNGNLCADVIGYHPMGFRADYDAEPDVDGGTPETDCTDGFCFRGAEKIYEILQEYGLDHLKIWATEVGWLATPPGNCLGHPSLMGRYWQIVTPEKQAENLVGALRYARSHWPWLETVFLFNLNFNEAPWYDDCEQMRFYSVLGTPTEAALGAFVNPAELIYLPLAARQ